MIDEMRKGKGSFIHRLTNASESELDEEIENAMEESKLTQQTEDLLDNKLYKAFLFFNAK